MLAGYLVSIFTLLDWFGTCANKSAVPEMTPFGIFGAIGEKGGSKKQYVKFKKFNAVESSNLKDSVVSLK